MLGPVSHAEPPKGIIALMPTRRMAFSVFALALVACSDSPVVTGGLSADVPEPVFFATNPHGRTGDQAACQGPLVVRDGCILIGASGNFSVPVWPEGFSLGTDPAAGQLTVRKENGATVAIEGEDFEMGAATSPSSRRS